MDERGKKTLAILLCLTLCAILAALIEYFAT